MSPEVRALVRATIPGILPCASALVASATGSSLDTNEVILAVLSGVIGFATLAAAEFGTPVNPTVGKGANNS